MGSGRSTVLGPLARRVLLAIAFGGALPALAVVTLSYVYRSGHVAELGERHRQQANRGADRLSFRLESLRGELATLAPAMATLSENADRVALYVARDNPDVTSIFWTTPEGSERFRWDRTEIVTESDLREWSGTPLLVATSVGRVYWGRIELNDYLEPEMVVAVPFYGTGQRYLGALGATLNVKTMWNLSYELDIGPGASGYVVNVDGIVIGHENASLVLKGFDASDVESVADAFSRTVERGTRTAVGLADVPVVYGTSQVPQTGWWVFVETPLTTALNRENELLAAAVGLLALSLIGTGGFAVWSSRRIARPVKRLTAATQALAGDVETDTSGSDEIEILARSFARMEESLEDKEQRLTWNNRRLEALRGMERELLRRGADAHLGALAVDAYRRLGLEAAIAICTRDPGAAPAIVSLGGGRERWIEKVCHQTGQCDAHGFEPLDETSHLEGSLGDEGSYAIYPLPRAAEFEGRLLVVGKDDTILEPQVVEFTTQMAQTLTIALERFRLAKHLENERAYVTQLVTSVPVAIATVSSEGIVRMVNTVFCELAGRGEGEILGEPVDALGVLGRDRAFIAPADLRVERWEATLQEASGSSRVISWTASRGRGPLGTTEEVILTGTDITEQRELEVQLRMAQKMEAVGQLAGGIAHDFNNLLTVINGYSTMMLDRIAEESSDRAGLERIALAGEKAASLTQQLLAFSRKQVLKPRVVSLNNLVQQLEPLLRRLLEESIEVVVECSQDLWPVRADPSQMEQVVLNLAINARDAMPSGGTLVIQTGNATMFEPSAVGAGTMPPGEYVQVTVSDTGDGIDDGILERIFEPFFTTKEAGKGTGLGLATVYGIVKQSSGYIRAESSPSKGARFEIWLPRSEAELEEERPAQARKALETAGEAATVLVVEDDPSVRSLVTTLLAELGYRTLAAESGAQALTLVDSHDGEIHMLLSDTVMPGMSGPELAEQLRARRPDLRVLLTSGYADQAKTVELPYASFIAKPFTPASLAQKISEVLDDPADAARS